MNFSEHIVSVQKRCKALPMRQHLSHMAMGVLGEYGELIDAAKKTEIYGKTMDVVHFKEEVGDVAWYISGFASVYGLPGQAMEEGFNLGAKFYADDEDQAKQTDGDFLVYRLLAVNAIIVDLVPLPGDSVPTFSTACKDITDLAGELGALCARWGFDIGEVLAMNDAKLEKRYGQKFSEQAALNRDIPAERMVLEGSPYDTMTYTEGGKHVDGPVAGGEFGQSALWPDNHVPAGYAPLARSHEASGNMVGTEGEVTDTFKADGGKK